MSAQYDNGIFPSAEVPNGSNRPIRSVSCHPVHSVGINTGPDMLGACTPDQHLNIQ